jgi:hypothetical protein
MDVTLCNIMDIIISVYACHTLERYKNQIKKMNETWKKDCENNGVRLLYFLGGEPSSEFTGNEYIYNKNINNDYLSASYKQWYGLHYIYENYKPKFILTCGTDTFVNIPKLVKYLNTLDHTENLYIGGHGCHRDIGLNKIYFHSGGPGFIITLPCLEKLYPLLPSIMDTWTDVCKKNGTEYLISASDVGIGYFCQLSSINANIIKTEGFFHCNINGFPCRHKESIDMRNIISCHSMSLSDFDIFNASLKSNNHYI